MNVVESGSGVNIELESNALYNIKNGIFVSEKTLV
jgi:hypothetical protein